jgi:hypothetical protein
LDAGFTSPAAERGGLERFHLGWRQGAGSAGGGAPPEGDREVAVVSHWISAEAAASGDAAGTSPLATVRRLLRDVTVAHYEIDETIGRHSDDPALALRIATGTFSRPGADAEMQNLLRQRAPLIGDEMAEAWVGRRLTGRSVEVTFVSAWRRLPQDRALEEAFWPDIALRSDQFVVEVFATLG